MQRLRGDVGDFPTSDRLALPREECVLFSFIYGHATSNRVVAGHGGMASQNAARSACQIIARVRFHSPTPWIINNLQISATKVRANWVSKQSFFGGRLAAPEPV